MTQLRLPAHGANNQTRILVKKGRNMVAINKTKLRPNTPVDFQVFAVHLRDEKGNQGVWVTITHHTASEIEMIERRRRNYPKTQFKTRWVVTTYRDGKQTVRPISEPPDATPVAA